MSALEVVAPLKPTHRGTTNGNARGSSYTRKRRREWLVQNYRANVDVIRISWPDGGTQLLFPADPVWERLWLQAYGNAERVPACRCYRCGVLLTDESVTVDRIIPGCKGGTYRRNNIRPACGPCNSETGGALASRSRS